MLNALSPDEFHGILCECNISVHECALMLDVSKRQIERWLRGESRITGPVAIAMHSIRVTHDNRPTNGVPRSRGEE